MLRHRGLIFAACNRYAKQGLTVDDLMQETMLAIWELREKLFSITLPPKQAAWIWHVARSTCIDLLRQTHPTEQLPEGFDLPVEDQSLHNALHEYIALLPAPDRTIVTLHLEGYQYEEIGQRVGMTKNHVGVRLMRIKEKLREQWMNDKRNNHNNE